MSIKESGDDDCAIKMVIFESSSREAQFIHSTRWIKLLDAHIYRMIFGTIFHEAFLDIATRERFNG